MVVSTAAIAIIAVTIVIHIALAPRRLPLPSPVILVSGSKNRVSLTESPTTQSSVQGELKVGLLPS